MNIFDYIRTQGQPPAQSPASASPYGLSGMMSPPVQVMSRDNMQDPDWRNRARWQASNINSLPGVMSPNSMTNDRIQNTLNMQPIDLQSQPQAQAIIQLLRGILPEKADYIRDRLGPWVGDEMYGATFSRNRDGSQYTAPARNDAFGGKSAAGQMTQDDFDAYMRQYRSGYQGNE